MAQMHAAVTLLNMGELDKAREQLQTFQRLYEQMSESDRQSDPGSVGVLCLRIAA